MGAVEVQVFRRCGEALLRVDDAAWDAFRTGQAPAPGVDGSAARKIDLLLITTRDGRCELAEPISLDLDANGYLQRLHVRFDALPRGPRVLDARHAFLGRYLQHANHWAVTERQLTSALSQCAADGTIDQHHTGGA